MNTWELDYRADMHRAVQWVMVGKYVLLSDSAMRIYHADPRQLLAFAESKK